VSTETSAPRGVPVHVPALDGVRGFAVLIVIFHNAGWIAGSSEQFVIKLFSAISATGWIGVSLFFALSGLLITGILLDSRGREGFFLSFYLRRTLRIFPLYYFFVAVTVFVAAPLAWSPEWAADVRTGQWPYWLYVSNWTQPFKIDIYGLTHLWSLAVEEQFYLVWPLLAYWLGRRGLAQLAVAMIVAGPFIRYGLRAAGLPIDATYFFTIARWDALAAGALLAALLRSERGRELVSVWTGRTTLALTLALAALVVVQRGFHSDDLPITVIGQSIIAGLSTCLLAYAVEAGPGALRGVQRVLAWPVLRTLGKYSYAMYVFHFPIHHALKVPLGPWVEDTDDALRIVRVFAYLALVLLLTFGASLLSWRLLEKPFLDLKERWAPRVG
jgi:peptidoglycan/LPS O-acetylase OafA/YrhL